MRYLLFIFVAGCLGIFGCEDKPEAWYFSNDILAEHIPSKIPPAPPPPIVPIEIPEVTPQETSVVIADPEYPLRRSWWSGCGSWHHLASGQHAGKFDPTWLAQLSNAELQSLHSDDHEGRVKWANVVRGTKAVAFPSQSYSNCPSGNCPTSSPRLFSRFIRR